MKIEKILILIGALLIFACVLYGENNNLHTNKTAEDIKEAKLAKILQSPPTTNIAQITNHEHYLKLSIALYLEYQNNIIDALKIYDDLYEKLNKKEYAHKVLYLSSLLKNDKFQNPSYGNQNT